MIVHNTRACATMAACSARMRRFERRVRADSTSVPNMRWLLSSMRSCVVLSTAMFLRSAGLLAGSLPLLLLLLHLARALLVFGVTLLELRLVRSAGRVLGLFA